MHVLPIAESSLRQIKTAIALLNPATRRNTISVSLPANCAHGTRNLATQISLKTFEPLMSFFGRLESNAIALQVADTLDSYEATLDAWLVEPGNLVLYAKMSSQIEAARMMSSSALPSASGALAELLLAHTDLTFIVLKKHMVRRGELTEAHEEKLAKAKKRPHFTLSEMRSLCFRLSTRRSS
jgi:hypothetical protein